MIFLSPFVCLLFCESVVSLGWRRRRRMGRGRLKTPSTPRRKRPPSQNHSPLLLLLLLFDVGKKYDAKRSNGFAKKRNEIIQNLKVQHARTFFFFIFGLSVWEIPIPELKKQEHTLFNDLRRKLAKRKKELVHQQTGRGGGGHTPK